MDFWNIYDKGVTHSIINSKKCVVGTILYIPTYPLINKYVLVSKYITGIFRLKTIKPKLNNASDVDLWLRYLDRLRDNTLLENLVLTQNLMVLHGVRIICEFTVDNMTLNDILAKILTNKVLNNSRKSIPLERLQG